MRAVKLTKVERAIIALAEHLEANPWNQYKIKQEILDILGYEFVREPQNDTRSTTKEEKPQNEIGDPIKLRERN